MIHIKDGEINILHLKSRFFFNSWQTFSFYVVLYKLSFEHFSRDNEINDVECKIYLH